MQCLHSRVWVVVMVGCGDFAPVAVRICNAKGVIQGGFNPLVVFFGIKRYVSI
jgi:hypothetical protein